MLIREIKYVTDESLNVCDLSITSLTNTLKNIQHLILRSNSISSCNTLSNIGNSRKNSNLLSPNNSNSATNTNTTSHSTRANTNGTFSKNPFIPSITKGLLYKNNVFCANANHGQFLPNGDFNPNESYFNQYIDGNGGELNSYSADEDEENKLSAYEHSNKHKLRKSLPAQIFRRIPAPLQQQQQQQQQHPVWSTTTSATGLPIVEQMPSRQRSLSLKGPTFSNSSHNQFLEFKVQKPADLPYSVQSQAYVSSSRNSGGDLSDTDSSSKTKAAVYHSKDKIATLDEGDLNNSSPANQNNSYDDEDEDANTNASSIASNVSSNQNKITSDYDSGESPNSSDYNSDTDKLHLQVGLAYIHSCPKNIDLFFLPKTRVESIAQTFFNRLKIFPRTKMVFVIFSLHSNFFLIRPIRPNFSDFCFESTSKFKEQLPNLKKKNLRS